MTGGGVGVGFADGLAVGLGDGFAADGFGVVGA
jgi:hypothetical protein